MFSCIGDRLSSVTALDARTVRFVLSKPDPRVPTILFPTDYIDSRAVVSAAFDQLMAKATGHDPGTLEQAAQAVRDEENSDSPDCSLLADQDDTLLTEVGVQLVSRDWFNSLEGGAFDACSYADDGATKLDAVAAALRTTGIDAVAAAYGALSFQQHPVGTGAWRLDRLDPSGIDLTAFPEGFHDAPAAPVIHLRPFDSFASIPAAIDTGALDIAEFVGGDDITTMRSDPAARLMVYDQSSFTSLVYNLRPGMLFADRNLRLAMQLCLDKDRTVAAATDGTGLPVDSPIFPASWAYAGDIAPVQRDPAAGRALIESSGWAMGSDGIYAKDGQRLALHVVVRADSTERIHFLQLASAQERDCGIELDVASADFFKDIVPMLSDYPHIAPGTTLPFEAYFGGENLNADPDRFDAYDSSRITGPSRPHADPFNEDVNFVGYSNPQVDQLLERGRATYDQRERARIYREFQHVVAADQPRLYAWSPVQTDALSAGMTSTAGPIPQDVPNWWWQLEALKPAARATP